MGFADIIQVQAKCGVGLISTEKIGLKRRFFTHFILVLHILARLFLLL